MLWLICQLHELTPSQTETPNIIQVDRVLRLAQGAQATDPRDKVYGILGLLPGTTVSQITPDYSLAVRQIYIDFTKSVIEATGNLEITLVGSRQGLDETWPSWVPDLSLGLDPNHILLGFNEPYRASGDSTAKVQFSADGERLSCKGFRIATVPPRGLEAPSAEESRPPIRKRHQSGEEEAAVLRFFGQTSFPQDTPASKTPNPDPAPRSLNWEQIQLHHTHAYASFLNGSLNSLLNQTPLSEAKDLITQTMMAYEQLTLYLPIFSSRSPVAFAEEHLIYASHAVQEGNEICVLWGCNYPVILGEKGEGLYMVVGECYIYDLKEGEAVGSVENGRCSVEKFILC